MVYNSIKSGIAVDYPVMTSSFTVGVPTFDAEAETSSSYRISSSFGYRLPFEATVQPEDYLGGITLVDQEPHKSASINSTASWDGNGSPLFEMGMNNFVAEVPRFFLRDEGVTTLLSAKDNISTSPAKSSLELSKSNSIAIPSGEGSHSSVNAK